MRCLCLFTLLALAGCGPSIVPTYPVKGKVTLDGQPLATGEIYFSLPGKTPAIFVIRDGQYEGKAEAGTHRIEICSYRPRAGKAEMPGMTLPPENILPAAYNTESKLTAAVDAGGANTFDFAVKK